MNAPLFNKLLAYGKSKQSFHMPGHKFGTIADINKLDLSLLDNTEVVGMDNLYDAKGVIKQAMALMADFYGAQETLFLTNGSTAGILASILALCKESEKIIVARNCHHSVWNGLILSGAIPIYVSPNYLSKDHLVGEVTAQEIKHALELHPDAKGVIIVSPTYEGVLSDIHAIAQVVHDYKKVLIVDEAHGAHFVIGDAFPTSSINLGADLVISSMHKTLPAITQSALLHRCSDKVSYSKLLSALRMIQTSSPSYMMMGLMDYIRCYILEHKEFIKKEYIGNLIGTRERLRSLQHLKLIEPSSDQYDISKIVLSTESASIDGYKLAEILNEYYNIGIEASFNTYIILMTTLADNKETLLKLEKALQAIDDTLDFATNHLKPMNYFKTDVTEGISLRQVYYAEKKWLDLEVCRGKIIAESIMLYPPGIPIVCIGEKLTDSRIRLIKALKDSIKENFQEKLQGVKFIEDSMMLKVIK